ncbi:MAG: hypothetical protein MJZ68_02560 [archaeon]|nr:hypothetical protein [archaeon]
MSIKTNDRAEPNRSNSGEPHRRSRCISDVSFEEFFKNRPTYINRRGFISKRPYFAFRDRRIVLGIPEYGCSPSDLCSLIIVQNGRSFDVGFLDSVTEDGSCHTIPLEIDIGKYGIDPLGGFDIMLDEYRVFIIRPFVFLMFNLSGEWIKHSEEKTTVVYREGMVLKGKDFKSISTESVGGFVYETVSSEPGSSLGAFPDKTVKRERIDKTVEKIPQKTVVKKEFKGDISSMDFQDFFRPTDGETPSENSIWEGKLRGVKVFIPKTDPDYSFTNGVNTISVFSKPPSVDFTIFAEDDYLLEVIGEDGPCLGPVPLAGGSMVIDPGKDGLYTLVVKCSIGTVTSRQFIYDRGFRICDSVNGGLPRSDSVVEFTLMGKDYRFRLFDTVCTVEAFGIKLSLNHRRPLVRQDVGIGLGPLRNHRCMFDDLPDTLTLYLEGKHKKEMVLTDGEREKPVFWYDNRDTLWLNMGMWRGFMRPEGLYRLMLSVDGSAPVCVMTVVHRVQ